MKARLPPAFASASRISLRRREAVHLRHRAVHEDDIVGLACRRLDGFDAVANEVAFGAKAQQRLAQHFAVHRVVVDRQDRQMPERLASAPRRWTGASAADPTEFRSRARAR